MIAEIVNFLGPWNWWILGLILLALEIAVPGFVLIWFGIAALIVGAVALMVDWPWQAELALFAVISLIAVVLGRRYFLRPEKEAGDLSLNERARRHIGRQLVLDTPIEQGNGRVRIGDTMWRITGPDMPSGTKIEVTGAEGSVLVVAPEGADKA
ncbi:MAG: NfeD family protein [Hyphomicrobiales bacterium]|nr:NfeD family protein [Hyphomicrobiales bacterium]